MLNLRRLCPAFLPGLLILSCLVMCGHATPARAAATPAAEGFASAQATDSTWWKHAVLYEIYPRSF